MARENQGLKGALIVFVLLTIVFAVITAVLFSGQTELKQKAKQFETQANNDKQAATTALQQLGDLQEKVGFKREDKFEDVEKGFTDDMKDFKAYAKEAQNYRDVLRNLTKTVDEKSRELVAANATNESKQKLLDAVNPSAAHEIQVAKNQAVDFGKARDKAISDYTSERNKILAQQERIANDLTTVQKGYEEALDAQNKNLKKVNEALAGIKKDYITATDKIRGFVREVPDTFLGSVKWVNQNTRQAWIDLGEADALRTQITFSVYAPGADEASEITKKASIRVTKILGEHLAEVKILEDKDIDPILPGDKLFTPLWNKNEKRHFALTGFADIDGDGTDDRQRVYALIELNGGVVDAPMGKDDKRQGEMSLNTRYLILGKVPEAAVKPGLFQDFNDMNRKAGELNVETISLQKFLEMIGWKNEAQVVDSGGSLPAGVDPSAPTSTGTVSELFKPRRPPRKFGGSVH